MTTKTTTFMNTAMNTAQPNLKKIIIFLIYLITVSMLSGCSHLPIATTHHEATQETNQATSTDLPPSGLAGVYIFRDSFVFATQKKAIKIDGQEIGKIKNNDCFHIVAYSGKRVFSIESSLNDETLTIELEAGKNYFLKCYTNTTDIMGNFKIKAIDEDKAKKDITENCSLPDHKDLKKVY